MSEWKTFLIEKMELNPFEAIGRQWMAVTTEKDARPTP